MERLRETLKSKVDKLVVEDNDIDGERGKRLVQKYKFRKKPLRRSRMYDNVR